MGFEEIGKIENTKISSSERTDKLFFEDSNRESGIDLPMMNNTSNQDLKNGDFYQDSNRENIDGPQWDEVDLNDLNHESDTEKIDSHVVYEAENGNKNGYDIKDEIENASDGEGKKDLTGEQKQEIKEKTGWSDEIIDSIGSIEEAEIYMNAGLRESEIDGKKCLIRDNIDMNQKDEDGITNKERMQRGRPPLTKDGQEVELHHIGQKPDSSLAELTTQEHRGIGNDTVLHDKNKESEIDRNEFAKERKIHWKSREAEGGE